MRFNCNGFSVKLVKIIENDGSRDWLGTTTPAKGHVRNT